MGKKFSFSNLYVLLVFVAIIVLATTAIIFSLNRYNEFVYGKFDLGNMNQMLYNSSRGHFMVITDYFGNNVPRWAMSHVDPSLLIFVPINWFYSDANFLLVAQITAFLFSAFLLYLIAKKQALSNIVSANVALLVFLLPVSGFILVWTTFHSLILAMPFLLLAYFLILCIQKGTSKNKYRLYIFLIYFSFFVVVASKEELGLIVFLFGIYLFYKFKNIRKHILVISVLSLVWTLLCFLVIIPKYSETRNTGIEEFIEYVGGVDDDSFLNYSGENYFLYRYSEFGDSYGEVAKNLILKPNLTFKLIFSKENIETINKLFLPVGYIPLVTPLLLLSAAPEIVIQMLTGDPTVFSIENHRLLITIPIFLLALIGIFKFLDKKNKNISLIISFILIFLNLVLAYFYRNPLIYPYYNKTLKKVFANTEHVEFFNDIRPNCAQFIVNDSQSYQKVSVPQPIGAKTSNKSYNALFPAGLKHANYIVADIYARKLVDFMDISTKYNKIAVQKLLDSEDVTLEYSCDRFFVLTKSTENKDLGSIQEDENANPILKQDLLEKSFIYDFKFTKLSSRKYQFVYRYKIGDEEGRKSMFAYTILIPKDGGSEPLTFVHFPSFYITPLNDFPVDSFVKETVIYNVPNIYKVLGKKYDVYFGIGNREKNEENVLVGEITL